LEKGKQLGMETPGLIIVCGGPGSGKSTLALHVVDRWGAVIHKLLHFANVTLALRLNPLIANQWRKLRASR
jgi:hypothetical protein